MAFLTYLMISSLAALVVAQTTPEGVITLPPEHRLTPFTQRQSCPPGAQAIVIKLNNLSTMTFTRMTTVSVQDLEECIQLCLMQNCAAFTYIEGSRTCKPQFDLDLTTLGKFDNHLYIKQCVNAPPPVSQCVSEPGLAFEAVHGTVLIGFAQYKAPADGYEHCLENCLNSQSLYEFDCLSVNYYPADRECILNTDKASKRKDLVNEKETDPVLYFERICEMTDDDGAAVATTQSSTQSTGATSTKDSPDFKKSMSTTPSGTYSDNEIGELTEYFDEKIDALAQMLNDVERRVSELEQQSDSAAGFRWQRVTPLKSN